MQILKVLPLWKWLKLRLDTHCSLVLLKCTSKSKSMLCWGLNLTRLKQQENTSHFHPLHITVTLTFQATVTQNGMKISGGNYPVKSESSYLTQTWSIKTALAMGSCLMDARTLIKTETHFLSATKIPISQNICSNHHRRSYCLFTTCHIFNNQKHSQSIF